MTSSSATASAYPMWMIQKHAKALRYCIYSTYLYIYITSHRKWYVSIHGQGRSWLVVVEVVDVVMATNMSTRWIIVTHNTHKTPYFFHPPGCHLHSSCDFCRIISHQKREMNSFHPNCTLCCSRFVFYIYVYVVLYRYITGEISICLPVYTWYDQTIKERNHATWLTSKENNHTGFGGFVSEPSAPFVSFQTSLLWFHLSPRPVGCSVLAQHRDATLMWGTRSSSGHGGTNVKPDWIMGMTQKKTCKDSCYVCTSRHKYNIFSDIFHMIFGNVQLVWIHENSISPTKLPRDPPTISTHNTSS